MSVDSFIDTNVIIYLFDETNAEKCRVAEELIEKAIENGSSCISFQVVQETINIVSRKLNASPEQARQLLDNVLEPLWKVNPGRLLYRHGLELQSRYKFGFYDCLIIAAALSAGCRTLYTEDLQHEQRVEGMTIINPFRVAVSEGKSV